MPEQLPTNYNTQPEQQDEDLLANVPGFDVNPMNGMDRGATLGDSDKTHGGIISGKKYENSIEHGRFVHADMAREALKAAGLAERDIDKAMSASKMRIELAQMGGKDNAGNLRAGVYTADGEKMGGGGMMFGEKSEHQRPPEGNYASVEAMRRELAVIMAEAQAEAAPAQVASSQTEGVPVAARTVAERQTTKEKRRGWGRRMIGTVAVLGVALGMFGAANENSSAVPDGERLAATQVYDGDIAPSLSLIDVEQTPVQLAEAPREQPQSAWVTQPGEGITQVLEREGLDYTLVFEKVGPNGETVEDLLGSEFGGFYMEGAAPAGVNDAETRIQSTGQWDPALQQRTIDLLKQAEIVRSQHR